MQTGWLFINYRAMLRRVRLRHRILSVRPSVCPSVTLRYVFHIGWKSRKLITRTISPTYSLFVAQTPPSEEHGKIVGRLEVGWEKVACWSTKAARSLTRAKIEEKLLWGAYRNSPPTLFRRYHHRPPTASLPQEWGLHPTLNFNRYYLTIG